MHYLFTIRYGRLSQKIRESKKMNETGTDTPQADSPVSKPAESTAPENKAPLLKSELPEGLISIQDFSKVQLRVGVIESAEKIEKSEKLIKLQVDLGADLGKKQILAGIAKHYNPETLLQKRIIVVANLKPAKLMGQLSEGMLLAASNEAGDLELVSVSEKFEGGATVR
jgi:methionyl-tRNA synthetase